MKKMFIAFTVMLLLCSAMSVAHAQKGKKFPRIVPLGTMPIGTSVNMAGTSLGTLVNRYVPFMVKVVPVAYEGVWVPMLETGEVLFGVGNMCELENAYLAKGYWEKVCKKAGNKGYAVRLVALGAKAPLSFNVRGDSKFKTIPDLKGAKIVSYAEGTGIQDFVLGSLADGNLTPADVNLFSVANPVEGGKALMDGRVDASYVAPDAPIIMQMVSTVHARYLPHDMSPEAQKRVAAVNHQLRVEMCETTFPHVLEKPIPMLIFDWGLFTDEKVSPDVVYEVIKAMYDHKEDLVEKPGLERWHPERFCSERVFVPYHQGAIKYYKEKGLWTPEMEKIQQKLLAEFKK